MKKLSCFLVAMLFLLMPALQSCDDNDGYSIGQFGGSWATVRVLSGNTYYLDMRISSWLSDSKIKN